MREDWIECTTEDVGQVITGGTPSKKKPEFYSQNDYPFYKPTDLNAGIDVNNSKDYLSTLGYANSRKAYENSILVTCIGATIGKTGLIKNDGAFNQQINALIPFEGLSNVFLYYQIIGTVFQQQIKRNAHSTTLPILNKSKFLKLRLNIPPYSIQKAIVKRIEELFSSLDSGIADLKKAQDQLVIYRQAVLKKAFEGDFINGKMNFSNQVNDDELPRNWKWASIFDFLYDNKKGMATGPFGTALKKHEHKQKGIPVLGIENIGEGKFKMPNKIFVTLEKSKALKSFKVLENDIIISRSGTVGEICSIPKKMEDSLISTNLIRVRLDLKKILPKYFVYLFQGGNVREQVKELCKGSTRVFLNQTILKKLKLPYCSIEEQKEVIKEIENRLSVCDKVEKDIANSLQKATALRQSILKKAFEGTLLSTEEIEKCKADKNYEPASVLLEKIRAEKENNVTKTVKKRKN